MTCSSWGDGLFGISKLQIGDRLRVRRCNLKAECFSRYDADDPARCGSVRTRARSWSIIGPLPLALKGDGSDPSLGQSAGAPGTRSSLRQAYPRYCPQTISHVERIDAYGAPERQLTELVLQHMAIAAERYAVAIRRFYSRAAVGARTHMRGCRGWCCTADDAGKLSDEG